MKQMRFVLPITLILALLLYTSAGEIEDFVGDVDAKWAAKDYSGMLQVIDGRLTNVSNDLAAVLLKMNYHLTIEYDLAAAQSYVDVFTNSVAAVDWSSDPQAEALCKVMVAEAIDPVEAASHGVIFGFSSNQLEQAHTEAPTNHPLSGFLLRVGGLQYP